MSGLVSSPAHAFVVYHTNHDHLVMNTIPLHVVRVVYCTVSKLLKGEMNQKKVLQ